MTETIFESEKGTITEHEEIFLKKLSEKYMIVTNFIYEEK